MTATVIWQGPVSLGGIKFFDLKVELTVQHTKFTVTYLKKMKLEEHNKSLLTTFIFKLEPLGHSIAETEEQCT